MHCSPAACVAGVRGPWAAVAAVVAAVAATIAAVVVGCRGRPRCRCCRGSTGWGVRSPGVVGRGERYWHRGEHRVAGDREINVHPSSSVWDGEVISAHKVER